eukprot:361880-Chlamydomonas_euryale.AAC.6
MQEKKDAARRVRNDARLFREEQARMRKRKPGRPPKALALAAAGQVTAHAPPPSQHLAAQQDQRLLHETQSGGAHPASCAVMHYSR